MPQLHLPMFPTGVTHITSELAFENKDGCITYFNGHMPVFTHGEKDVATFRMITSQFGEPIAKLPGDNWDCGSSRLAMIARRVFCKPALDHGAVDAMHWQFLDAVRLCGCRRCQIGRRTDRCQMINRKS